MIEEIIEQLKKIAKLDLPSENEIKEEVAYCSDLIEMYNRGVTDGQTNLARNILTKLGVNYD